MNKVFNLEVVSIDVMYNHGGDVIGSVEPLYDEEFDSLEEVKSYLEGDEFKEAVADALEYESTDWDDDYVTYLELANKYGATISVKILEYDLTDDGDYENEKVVAEGYGSIYVSKERRGALVVDSIEIDY